LQVQIYKQLSKCKWFFKIIFMNAVKKRSECPLSCSLDVFGDKWTLLIIRDLMFNNKNTYGDFLKSAEGIATNILASRLQTLEENNIIEKLPHPESKAKVMYRLTQKGIDLLPILIEIYLWAEKYFTVPNDIKLALKDAKKDRDTFIALVTKGLKSSNKPEA
jgi:DNA-binding HxlR family transcriptional regulator